MADIKKSDHDLDSGEGEGLGFNCLNHAVDPQEVVDAFWQQGGAEVERLIEEYPQIERLLKAYGKSSPVLTEARLKAVILEHERAFIDNIIIRLARILNQATQKEGRTVFNIQTSMLYDVDETLGGTLLSYQGFCLRPAVGPLFEFITKKLPAIHIGIISTRDHECLQRQLTGEENDGDISDIAPYITAGAEGIYSVGGMTGASRNNDHRDNTLYPNWQPESDLPYILEKKLGLSEEESAEVMSQMPVFEEAVKKESVLSYPSLYFSFEVEKAVRSICRNNFWEFDMEEVAGRFTAEILMYTEEIAIAIDQGKDLTSEQNRIVEGVMNIELSDLPEGFANLVRPAIIEAVQASWDAILGIGQRTWNEIPEGMTSRQSILKHLAEQSLKSDKKRGLPSLISYEGYQPDHPENGFYKLKNRILVDEDGPIVMNPQFQTRVSNAYEEIVKENRAHVNGYNEKIAKILGVNSGYALQVIQRMAACKRQLDSGVVAVSIAVDNLEAAKKMDDLLQGRVAGKDGVPLDGYKELKIEEYRGRLHVIHVGNMAEFQEDTFSKRLKEAISA